MNEFVEAEYDEKEVQRLIRETIQDYRRRPELYKGIRVQSEAGIRGVILEEFEKCRTYLNDQYTVSVRDQHVEGWGLIYHLSIKRNDREPIHDWRDLQEIKNRLYGDEYEAVELYPAESRKVDSANQYHLWVLSGARKFPFGFQERFVTDSPGGKARQRKGSGAE